MSVTMRSARLVRTNPVLRPNFIGESSLTSDPSYSCANFSCAFAILVLIIPLNQPDRVIPEL